MFEKLKTLLFGEPKPIPQVELNIGKLTATILFKTGDQIVKTFEGEYIESVWMGFSRFWYDCYVTANERFIGKRLDSTGELENKLEIVKFVIEYKQEKAEAAKNRAAKAEQKAFLLDLKRRKEVAALENLSTEEIDKQLAALGE